MRIYLCKENILKTLSDQLVETAEQSREKIPADARSIMNKATQDLQATGIEGRVLQNGQKAPSFILKNHLNNDRSLETMLADGPVVVSFYRGGWWPYCNLELVALQRSLLEIEALGAKLVTITPETPDNSLSTKEKNDLTFEVLFDEGNKVAKSYGLVFSLSKELRPIYSSFGIDLEKTNGDSTFTLPIPATYVIKTDGTVVYYFADADYTKRLEPAEVVKALREI
jgi:peroxiredoxin